MARHLFLQKLLQEHNTLKEIYKPTDLKPVQIVLKVFLQYLYGSVQIPELIKIENTYKIQFEILEDVSDEFLVHKAEYIGNTDFVRIYIYSNTLDRIQENKKLIRSFLDEVESLFTHEDTHKQQYSKKGTYRYNVPDYENDPEGYLSHYSEVDAYARQIGYLLRQEFPELSVSEIFDKIKNEQVKNILVLDRIETYKNPSFRTKESRRFFHTLYQYLDNQEIHNPYIKEEI